MTIVNRRILYGRRQGRRLRAGQKALLTGGLERFAVHLPSPGERVDPADAVPFYVRDKVAKTVAERLAEGGRA